jgi:hypothetical protein
MAISFDRKHGSLRSLRHEGWGCELISDPARAESWRILLPLDHFPGHCIFSKDQKLSGIENNANGLKLTWKNVVGEEGQVFPISVRMSVASGDNALQIWLEVENDTDYPLAEIHYPVLNGVLGIGEPGDSETQYVRYWGEPQNQFKGIGDCASFNLGRPKSLAAIPYPCTLLGVFTTHDGLATPWVDIVNRKNGHALYVGHHEKRLRSCYLFFESEDDARTPSRGVPAMDTGGAAAPDEPSGLPLTMSWVSLPYTKRGKFQTAPVHLEFHEGGWQQAGNIYHKWYDSVSPFDHRQRWLRREHAWNSVNLMTSEGQILYPYSEIPDMARQAKKYGVKVLHINGWWKGGHDRSYPFYEPEPRLGGEQALRDAIAQCHKLGVKVMLFANLQWADAGTEWFKKEGHRYVRMHPSGLCRFSFSFGHGTASASNQLTAPMLVEVSPAFPAFQQLIEKQIVNIASLGADGVMIDKVNTTGGLCFNPGHGLAPDEAFAQAMLDSVAQIVRKCRAVNLDFGVAAECQLDRMMPYIDLTYTRFGVRHTPYMKTLFPAWTSTVCIMGVDAYAFDSINMAVRCGYFISAEFPGFRRGFGDKRFEVLSKYLAEVLRIRRRLEDTIYFGEFMDTQGARVENATPDILYGVFRNAETDQYACVIQNVGEKQTAVTLRFDHGSNKWRTYSPFHGERAAEADGTIGIEPHSFAIVTAK